MANLQPFVAAPAEEVDSSTSGFDREFTALVEKYLGRGEPDLFDRATKLLVATAFAGAGANQVRAAELLGISRNVLRTQLAHLGVIEARTRRKADRGAAR